MLTNVVLLIEDSWPKIINIGNMRVSDGFTNNNPGIAVRWPWQPYHGSYLILLLRYIASRFWLVGLEKWNGTSLHVYRMERRTASQMFSKITLFWMLILFGNVSSISATTFLDKPMLVDYIFAQTDDIQRLWYHLLKRVEICINLISNTSYE